jgi:hypothetical protein
MGIWVDSGYLSLFTWAYIVILVLVFLISMVTVFAPATTIIETYRAVFPEQEKKTTFYSRLLTYLNWISLMFLAFNHHVALAFLPLLTQLMMFMFNT